MNQSPHALLSVIYPHIHTLNNNIKKKKKLFEQEFPFSQRQVRKGSCENGKTSCKRQEVVTPRFLWCYEKKIQALQKHNFKWQPGCVHFLSAMRVYFILLKYTPEGDTVCFYPFSISVLKLQGQNVKTWHEIITK